MDVYWLELSRADVPDDESWLSTSEARQLATMRVPKRRADWRLGRWTAKRAAAAYLGLPDEPAVLFRIEVVAAESGAPQILLKDAPAAISISLSHCAGRALCALTSPKAMLGCDLESIEPRSDAFVSDYFTEDEQALIASAPGSDRWLRVALLWSAKESALKALQEGLRRDTRSVQVVLGPGPGDAGCEWRPFHAECREGGSFRGLWSRRADLVRTLVAAPSTSVQAEIDLKDLSTACV